MLFHVALRSLCEGSEERLFLEEPVDAFVSEIDLPDTSPEFTKRYLAAFREPLPEDESKAALQDRLDTGWLAWSSKMEVTRLPGWEEQAWETDSTCQPAIEIFETAISAAGWWQQVCDQYVRNHELSILQDRRTLGAGGYPKLSFSNTHRFRALSYPAFWKACIRGDEADHRGIPI